MSNEKSAVFILLGQSNAVGYATLLPEGRRIETPLQHVFGLTRENNLSFDSRALVWTGYTSAGTILGEENDHTCSVSNCLARVWQDAIDRGRVLPELYIITIAIGAQGVTPGYMWHPARPPKLIPGPLGTADISLAPFARHIFSLLDSSFREMGRDYEIIGLHWRGGENDMSVPKEELAATLKPIYEELLRSFYESLGQIPPVMLHDIVCAKRAMDLDPSGRWLESMYCIDSVFRELAAENDNISVFDVRRAPYYEPDTPLNGIFLPDAVHFTPEMNLWAAETILDGYLRSHNTGCGR